MTIRWEVFALMCSLFIGLGAVLWSGIKWFGQKLIRDIEAQFSLILVRLDKMNGQVGRTAEEISEHKLYAAETFVHRDTCKERRDDCSARSGK
jgi:hypothetical protein